MKRIVGIFLVCLLFLGGCQGVAQSNKGTPFVFYYPSAASGGETLVEQTVYFPDGLPMLPELKVTTQYIPASGTYSSVYIRGMAVLVPDLEANIALLRETLR